MTQPPMGSSQRPPPAPTLLTSASADIRESWDPEKMGSRRAEDRQGLGQDQDRPVCAGPSTPCGCFCRALAENVPLVLLTRW